MIGAARQGDAMLGKVAGAIQAPLVDVTERGIGVGDDAAVEPHLVRQRRMPGGIVDGDGPIEVLQRPRQACRGVLSSREENDGASMVEIVRLHTSAPSRGP